MVVREGSGPATRPGVRRMPMPSVLPTMTARPKPTPRMRMRPPDAAAGARASSFTASLVMVLEEPACYTWRTGMEYRRLGTTGLKVSRLGLGCGGFGGIGSSPAFFGKGESEPEAFALMDRAWEAGINFFDTADAYGGGRSETFIGHWLKEKGPRVRDGLLLSSKVFNPVGEGPNDRGLSRRHILRQVETSLARLGVDYLDMYLIHEPDPETPLEETVSALDDLVRAGKVLYVGASNIEAWRLTRALWI